MLCELKQAICIEKIVVSMMGETISLNRIECMCVGDTRTLYAIPFDSDHILITPPLAAMAFQTSDNMLCNSTKLSRD